MIQKRGLKQMLELTQLSLEQSARLVQARIATLKDGEFKLNMDNGSHIMVKLNKIDRQQDNTTHIEPHQKAFRVDFTGTSPQGAHNFHAPAAVTRASVLYVFRTLVSDDIPLNEGCMWPIDLILPEDSLLNPSYPAAVVAGNVETSQAVVNALYGALGVVAASQGTMNNVTFGNERFQYYETVCGGTGAGETYAGRSAVQGHMTNSKLTDPEILEHRFPIRVQHFGVRRGSGGQGQHRGGDGAQRELMFLEPMELNLLSQSREVLPFGLNGGKAAQGG
jgi:N-methylhydantoinase B/oxoprolinase/acetone carboxylase alpha subunit